MLAHGNSPWPVLLIVFEATMPAERSKVTRNMRFAEFGVRLGVVGVVASGFSLLGAFPDEVPNLPVVVAAAVFALGFWHALATRLYDRRVGTALLVGACLLSVTYSICLDRLTFAYPPGQPTATYVAGFTMTPAARAFQERTQDSSPAQVVAAFGGLSRVELVWSSGDLAMARLVLTLVLGVTVVSLASTVLYFLPRLPVSGSANQEASALPRMGPLLPGILVLAANPMTTERLALDREVKEIKQRLLNANAAHRLRLETLGAIRADELADSMLAFRPDIVHFSGHGEAGALYVEDERGNAVPLDQQRLAKLFGILRGGLRCVVLNACFSEQQAKMIAEHVPCVVGMRAAVEDDSAIAFAGQFYSALAFGKSVKVAFDLACNQLGLIDLPGAEVPSLVTRPGQDPAQVYLLPQQVGE
jgi:hypothetical protein